MVNILFNAAEIRTVFGEVFGELTMDPSVVNAILEWTINLTVEPEETTNKTPLDLLGIDELDAYKVNKEKINQFKKKMEKFAFIALDQYLTTFSKKPSLFGKTKEEKQELLRRYFNIDTPEGAAAIGQLAHWASVSISLSNRNEDFDFESFLKKFVYIAEAENHTLMSKLIQLEDSAWNEMRDPAKMQSYIKKVSELSNYDMQYNLDEGEIIAIMKGEVAKKEGKTFADAQKITEQALKEAKLNVFLKKLMWPLIFLGAFISFLMWRKRPSTVVKTKAVKDEAKEPEVYEDPVKFSIRESYLGKGKEKKTQKTQKTQVEENISEGLSLSRMKNEAFGLGRSIDGIVWEAAVKLDPYWHKMTVNLPIDKLAQSDKQKFIETLNFLKEKKPFNKVLGDIRTIDEANLDLCLSRLKVSFGPYVVKVKSIPPRNAKNFSFKAKFFAKFAEKKLWQKLLGRKSAYQILLEEMGDVSLEKNIDKKFTAREWKFSRRKTADPYDKFGPGKWAAFWAHIGITKLLGATFIIIGLYINLRAFIRGAFDIGALTPSIYLSGLFFISFGVVIYRYRLMDWVLNNSSARKKTSNGSD